MAYTDAFVRCHCGIDHKVKNLKTINIEEDMQGRDTLTYICPVDKKDHTALVLRNR